MSYMLDASKRIVKNSPMMALIRKKELAEMLRVSTKTIDNWLKKGQLPVPFKTNEGRIVGWSRDQLDKWKESNFR